MPTMNSQKYLKETINSIESQAYKNIELIVVDKNSKDNTLNIIQKSNIKNIKIIEQKDDTPERAVAKGFKNASGDFIQFLGSDDVLHDILSFQKIANNVDKFKDMILYMNYLHIDKHSNVLKEFNPKFNYKKILNDHNYISATSFLVNKKLFQKFDFDGNEGFDLDLILRFGDKFIPKKISIFHSAFRVHGDSHSGNFHKNIRNIKNDFLISKKYGGHLLNKYHLRYILIKFVIFFRLSFLLEFIRKLRWKIKGIKYV